MVGSQSTSIVTSSPAGLPAVPLLQPGLLSAGLLQGNSSSNVNTVISIAPPTYGLMAHYRLLIIATPAIVIVMCSGHKPYWTDHFKWCFNPSNTLSSRGRFRVRILYECPAFWRNRHMHTGPYCYDLSIAACLKVRS